MKVFAAETNQDCNCATIVTDSGLVNLVGAIRDLVKGYMNIGLLSVAHPTPEHKC
jgi:hypothetical protein